MPFVFLPELTENGYNRLKEKIFEKWDLAQNNKILRLGEKQQD